MPRQSTMWGALLAVVVASLFGPAARADERAKPAVDFARDVWPIFQRACVECHGPRKQEGGLRLDDRGAFQKGGDSGPVVVAGDAAGSELIRRVSLPQDDSEVMPAIGAKLTKPQIEQLRRWIDAGAVWPQTPLSARHWAYERPVRPALPSVKDVQWPRNSIDYFILARLENEGLAPSPEADRYTLARRVYLDLTGLPPSPAEVDALVNDPAPDAYERLVDRLLASDQFGVRWARPWLDYARYADSHGFQRDDLRDLWPYRDWVVDALNSDMPFDRFTIEQLAGDLLPDATAAQKIATGFNRSAPTNVEAGSDPEETRVNQVLDRVNTLGMVWLGTTLECCQCHDHKYDPFTSRDYYSLFAFFNNTALEAERANPKVPGSIKFQGPEMEIADPAIDRARDMLAAQIAEIDRQIASRGKELARHDDAWEAALRKQLAAAPRAEVLEITEFDSLGDTAHDVLPDRSILLSGEAPDKDTYTIVARTTLTGIRAFKLETLADPSLPGMGPGRGDAARPNFVLHRFSATAAPPAGGKPQPVSLVGAVADFSQSNRPVAGAIDNDPKTGWAINPEFHQSHWATFEADKPVGFEEGTVLTFKLEQNYGGSRTIGRLRLSALTGKAGQGAPDEVVQALNVSHGERSNEQRQALAQFRQSQDKTYQRLEKEKRRLTAERDKLKPTTSLVMQELPEPRSSFMFVRGDFRTPGETVTPATPAILPTVEKPDGERLDRVDLAHWIVDAKNPLPARVTVNRWWGELFGHGLVTTPEDFGLKGDPPTHPELLDWLAVELVERGWSMKQVVRTMVLSSTYRQSSKVTRELLARDDQNLLYARGARFRLDAEAIRDNALAIAGVVSRRTGGAPIKPYQPDGLWVKVGGQRYDYIVSPGDEKYRRGLYVVWKRAAPYPSFVNFDANSRLACRVKRPRSNTPLQALTLMNDPVYVEAALHLAARVLAETPEQPDDARLERAYRLAVARPPRPAELATLRRLLEDQRRATRENSKQASELVKDFRLPERVSAEAFAPWYAVAAALLNLDETISKE